MTALPLKLPAWLIAVASENVSNIQFQVDEAVAVEDKVEPETGEGRCPQHLGVVAICVHQSIAIADVRHIKTLDTVLRAPSFSKDSANGGLVGFNEFLHLHLEVSQGLPRKIPTKLDQGEVVSIWRAAHFFLYAIVLDKGRSLENWRHEEAMRREGLLPDPEYPQVSPQGRRGVGNAAPPSRDVGKLEGRREPLKILHDECKDGRHDFVRKGVEQTRSKDASI